MLAPLSRSVYCRAGDEIVWLGTMDAILHPRAMLTSVAGEMWGTAVPGQTFRIDAGSATSWIAPRPDPAQASRSTLIASAGAVLAARTSLGRADGLGVLLGGDAPAFPLHDARGHACALARAFASDDGAAAIEPAIALLGLGAGLTPSGDDFVGGAFFARAIFAELDDGQARDWSSASRQVLSAAAARTHPISLALLSDMIRGDGHAPLHTLAISLATGAAIETALDAARSLTRIGHSSGWDMLAGLLGGILGPAAFA